MHSGRSNSVSMPQVNDNWHRSIVIQRDPEVEVYFTLKVVTYVDWVVTKHDTVAFIRQRH